MHFIFALVSCSASELQAHRDDSLGDCQCSIDIVHHFEDIVGNWRCAFGTKARQNEYAAGVRVMP